MASTIYGMTILASVLLLLVSFAVKAVDNFRIAGEGITKKFPEWSYSGEKGPQNWAKLGYKVCAGKKQSPIRIDDVNEDKNIERIQFHNYDKKFRGIKLRNGGNAGVKLEIRGDNEQPYIDHGGLSGSYEFSHMHFYFGKKGQKGTQHEFKGMKVKDHPMEMHFVHRNEDDIVVVVAVLFDETTHNIKGMEPIVNNLDKVLYKGAYTFIKESFSLMSLFPGSFQFNEFIRYNGSMVTPPCTEGIIWSVYTSYAQISTEQMAAFRKVYSSPLCVRPPNPMAGNVRPVQPINGRKIKKVVDNNKK